MSWTQQSLKMPLVILGSSVASVGAAFHFKNVGISFLAFAIMLFWLGRYSKRFRPFSLAAVSTLVSLAIAEFVIPAFIKDEQNDVYFDRNSDYVTDKYWALSDVGYQAISGVHRVRKFAADGAVLYDVVYTIGDDGFRLSELKHPGSRINFFGCSFTFGEGLNDDETLPYAVSENMKTVSAKNFGFHAYGPHQALAILQSDRDTSGDINFYLTAPWHAPRSACVPTWSKGSPKFELRSDGTLARVGRCAEESSNVFQKFLSNSNIYSLVLRVADIYKQDKQIELYLRIVEEMSKISHARNQKFIIGFIKERNSFYTGRFNNDEIYQRLSAISDDIIDLTLAEKAESLSAKYYINVLDQHPSAAANRERAVILNSVFRKYLN